MELNVRQIKACQKLQEAMSDCSGAGLLLYVANGSLLAYDKEALNTYMVKVQAKMPDFDRIDAMRDLQEDAQSIDTFETDLDGGDF